MRKRKVLLAVALGTVCFASSAAASNPQMPVRPDNAKVKLNSAAANSQQMPVWPDDAKVNCSGINSCKGKGSCQGAANSCAGKNPCKGIGWVSTTAKECKDKGGKILASAADNKSTGSK